MAPSRKSDPRTSFKIDKYLSALSAAGKTAIYLKKIYGKTMAAEVLNLLSMLLRPAILQSEGASKEDVEKAKDDSLKRCIAYINGSLNGAIGEASEQDEVVDDQQDEGDRAEDEEDVFGVMEDEE